MYCTTKSYKIQSLIVFIATKLNNFTRNSSISGKDILCQLRI